MLERIALLAVATLRLFLAHGLLALFLVATCIRSCLLLTDFGLLAALSVLGTTFVLVLFLLVAVAAITAIVLRAGSGGHAHGQGSTQGDGPKGLWAGAELHGGTFAGRSGMLLACVYLASVAMNGF